MFTKVLALALLSVAASKPQSGGHGYGGHSSGASYVSFALGHGDLGGHGGGLSGGLGGGLSGGHGLGGGLSGGHGLGGGSSGGLGGHHGGYLLHAAPVAISQGQGHGHDEHYVDYHAHPKYEFKYGVADGHTHDHHSQQEVRDGDVVKGEYSLQEPDGTIRIVKYTADHKNGFNAQVIRQGHAVHPETTHKGHFVHYGGGQGGHGGY